MTSSEEEAEKGISYFAAGPSKLPKEVLEEIRDDLPYFKETNLSILEILHSSTDFDRVISNAESVLRELLDIPDNYRVLFLQGGGTGQFAAIPMNLISRTGKADYIVTGLWSRRAARECQKYGTVNFVLPPTDRFTGVPVKDQWKLSSDASFVFYCDNETVDGIEFDFIPEAPEGVPLVCDMSSNICTRSVDVSKFGVIFAGAQKNIGCAGVTVIIVREDLIGHQLKICPSVWDFEIMNRNGSRRNTSPTFPIYVMDLCLKWVKMKGGVKEMHKKALKKSGMIYDLIDTSNGFYVNLIDLKFRSRMNVTFRIGGSEGNDALEKKFLAEATEEGLLCLKGHRPVFGIRASLYNSVTASDVARLVHFMTAFLTRNT